MMWLCLPIRLFQGLSEDFSGFPMDSLDLTDEPHPTFLLQGHILNIGGDALSLGGGVDIDGPYCQTSFIIDMHMISRHDFIHTWFGYTFWLQSWRSSCLLLLWKWTWLLLLYNTEWVVVWWQVLPGKLARGWAGWQNCTDSAHFLPLRALRWSIWVGGISCACWFCQGKVNLFNPHQDILVAEYSL